VLSYLLAGVLVVLVMRMLGEMAVANPSTGSFADLVEPRQPRVGADRGLGT
jgi:L-asparagine transporter-like permease